MKFAVIRLEYSLARERDGGAAIFIDVEGVPETLAELQQFGGKTRQTWTLTECEARGISLPSVLSDVNADMAKRLTAAEASIVEINDSAKQRVSEAEEFAQAATVRAERAEAAVAKAETDIARIISEANAAVEGASARAASAEQRATLAENFAKGAV